MKDKNNNQTKFLSKSGNIISLVSALIIYVCYLLSSKCQINLFGREQLSNFVTIGVTYFVVDKAIDKDLINSKNFLILLILSILNIYLLSILNLNNSIGIIMLIIIILKRNENK